jgi:23S rRNA (adenine2503-C2)-methyltransferase
LKKDILSLGLPELTEEITALGEKSFRAKQIFNWLHVKRVTGFSQMSDISAALREKLEQQFTIIRLGTVHELISKKDNTRKYLFELLDGEFVETVFMEYKHAFSLCISSQVGCKMGCSFCASGRAGFVRNLSPSEMLSQVYETERLTGETIGSLVMMGIGEPLDNFDNTIAFLRLLSDEHGKNLSLRHVSLSTCGLVPRIRELAGLRLGLTLSVSLHQADDTARSAIMPINKAYNIGTLIDACRDYIAATGRRVSFEYAVIGGVNDSAADADRLIKLLHGMNCHVNLIPVNNVKESGFFVERSSVLRFLDRLSRGGLGVTIRRTLGSDIEAACGQLRRNERSENP